MNNRLTFISWAPHCSRSDSIAARLGGTSHMVYAPFWGSRLSTVAIKYLVQSVRTLRILWREHPQVVFVMAPPIIACVPVWLYCLITGSRFVIDAHTGAFDHPRWRRLQWLQRFFSRRAATTIVTNRHLANVVRGWDATATIVTDVPVEFAEPVPVGLPPGRHIAVVCSFWDDEPIEEIFAAAALLPETQFHITGDHRRLSASIWNKIPANVRLTGFLSDGEYVGLLRAADGVVALTTRDHTMQRAAYEAVYLQKPVVTSDFPLLREAFPKGTVHVKPVASSIAEGIARLLHDSHRMEREVAELREQKIRQWEAVAQELLRIAGLPARDAHQEQASHSGYYAESEFLTSAGQ